MKNVYLLSLFYGKAINQATTFSKILKILNSVSNDVQRIETGENHTAIAFTSDLADAQLRERLNPMCQEGLHILVTQVSALSATNVSSRTIQWFDSRLQE